ncbi:unnamed protein product [Durusdinium trenchii]|uniref:Uncharacterized protein n=1 Tax=Durusdinium trenchii TaxID=1381693 RepID=A0ABP0S617_9DINO
MFARLTSLAPERLEVTGPAVPLLAPRSSIEQPRATGCRHGAGRAFTATLPVLAAVRRRAKPKRRESAFDPIAEYKRVQSDPLGSWGFLEEEEFAQRMASFTAVAFVPSILLSVTVFPPSDEEGIFLPNMLAAFAYGLGLTMAVSFLLLLRISSLLDPLNKGLKATSYLVEDSRNKRSLPGDGGYYSEVRQKTKEEVQRDQLLGEYQTNPAMGRLRKYLVGAAALSVLGWVLGSISGGEMSLNEDEEDERKCGTRCIPGLMTDDSGIQRNSYRLFTDRGL